MSAQGADEQVEEQGSDDEAQNLLAEAVQSGSDDKSDKKPDVEQLMKENAKYRARIRELKPLAEKWAEKENSEKSEAQLLKEELQKIQEASETNLKKAVAAEAGMPLKLIPLLSGTEDEMLVQAKALAEEFGNKKPVSSPQGRPTPLLRTGQSGADNRQDVNGWLRSLAGK